jgi:hypothetical protein
MLYLFETSIWSNIDGQFTFEDQQYGQASQTLINKIKIYKENMHNLITLQS